jgi:excisionase family DNA binding protein
MSIMTQQTRPDYEKRRMAVVDDPWLTVRQAAAYAGVCEKTIRRAYIGRQIQCTRVGRVVRFRRAWIDEWMLRAQVVAVA